MKGGARPGSGRKRALYDEKRVMALRKQGFTYQEIADRFGVTKSAISYFFKTYGRKYEA
jgi:transcriptional regulator